MADMEKVRETFNLYVVQGAPTATALSNKNYAKLCKDCKIVDGSKITNADIDITFSKHKSPGQQTVTYDQFVAIMQELGSKRYGRSSATDIFKLIEGKRPISAPKSTAMSVVDRLTDTSKYTGAHKSRFGADGKGKGLDGREERADHSGYVSGYKNKGSYQD